MKWPRIVCAVSVLALYAAAPEPSAEPKVTSIFPMGGEVGKPFEAAIRGKNLKEARAVWFPGGDVDVRVIGAEEEVVRVALTLTKPGGKEFRVVTPQGVSNSLKLTDSPAPSSRIEKPGAVNTHPITVKAGQTFSFDVHSGFSKLDPVITIAEKSGSWFDKDRINPVAANDDPLFFPGLSTDAHLVHKFAKGGDYLVQVSSFSGQGGPDYVYQLAITPGETPAPVLHPTLTDLWEERQFTRTFGRDWQGQLAARAADVPTPKTVEIYKDVPVFTPPGILEGRIQKPGEAHLIQVKIDKAQDLAIEIETPEATMPRFNPIVRLMEPGGGEIVTNVYTKLNNNGLYMMKMIQAKTTFSLTAPGVYTLQIRDITTDKGGADFRYRVLVRPQIPHVGKLVTAVDHINLKPGETQTISVTLDREEEFKGVVALFAEGLPPGVTAIPAMDRPDERPPLPNGGKLERYTPKPQTASLLLIAAPDAAASDLPVTVRLSARVVAKGQLKDAIPVAEIPLMILPRRVQ